MQRREGSSTAGYRMRLRSRRVIVVRGRMVVPLAGGRTTMVRVLEVDRAALRARRFRDQD
jgi:hypothetical protein